MIPKVKGPGHASNCPPEWWVSNGNTRVTRNLWSVLRFTFLRWLLDDGGRWVRRVLAAGHGAWSVVEWSDSGRLAGGTLAEMDNSIYMAVWCSHGNGALTPQGAFRVSVLKVISSGDTDLFEECQVWHVLWDHWGSFNCCRGAGIDLVWKVLCLNRCIICLARCK